MLGKFITKYFDNILYIQMWSEMLKVVNVNSGAEFYQPPYIAFEKNSTGKSLVKAVGAEAKILAGTANIEVTNAFLHLRD
jgi:hypothetical protein